MKYHEPRLVSLVNSLLITVVFLVLWTCGALLLSPQILSQPSTLLFLILSSLILFFTAFLVFRYTLEKFIYSKIRLIYKSIHAIKTKKGESKCTKHDRHLLDEVSQEVAVWQQEKSIEIEQLRQLEKYRREFIGNISHELKTPLFNIQGYVLTLLDGGLDDPSINLEYLRRTEKSVERLIHIVEDLDEITQLESGQMKLTITRFDLVTLTREVLELLEMKARKKEVTLVFPKSEKPIFVEGDLEKIRQVITNICENSIRYGIEKGETKITFFDMGENILIEITDNGIGIDPEELPRVYERFFRTTRGRASFNKGKGLGLAIVKHIIEAHEQTINVRSTVGVGTTFGFTLKKAKN